MALRKQSYRLRDPHFQVFRAFVIRKYGSKKGGVMPYSKSKMLEIS